MTSRNTVFVIGYELTYRRALLD